MGRIRVELAHNYYGCGQGLTEKNLYIFPSEEEGRFKVEEKIETGLAEVSYDIGEMSVEEIAEYLISSPALTEEERRRAISSLLEQLLY